MLDASNAIWDDGEWVGYNEINQQIQYKEWRVKYPKGDLSLVPILESLLITAEEYFHLSGKHLQLYGDIGELFCAITCGAILHKNFAQGSDGRIGNDFVEVKTITPFNQHDKIEVKRAGHFNKLFIAKINQDFQISGKLVDRKSLPGKDGKIIRISWNQLAEIS